MVVAIPTLLTLAVASLQLGILMMLILPMPLKYRKSLIKMLLESPIFAKLIYGLKISAIFVLVLLVDAANSMWKLTMRDKEYRGDQLDGGDMGTPANADRSARILLAERNLALTATTLFLTFLLWRVFEMSIQVIELGEKLAMKEGQTIGHPIDESRDAFKELQSAQNPDFLAQANEGNAMKRKNVAVHDKSMESSRGDDGAAAKKSS